MIVVENDGPRFQRIQHRMGRIAAEVPLKHQPRLRCELRCSDSSLHEISRTKLVMLRYSEASSQHVKLSQILRSTSG